MANVFTDTSRLLARYAEQHESILVSFSGGKDSLVCLDLCTRAFKRVVCYFMYFVKDLECCEQQLQYARDRWGVEILQYPHWILFRCLKNGVYCNNHISFDQIGRAHV